MEGDIEVAVAQGLYLVLEALPAPNDCRSGSGDNSLEVGPSSKDRGRHRIFNCRGGTCGSQRVVSNGEVGGLKGGDCRREGGREGDKAKNSREVHGGVVDV